MQDKGYVSLAQYTADQLALQKAKFTYEQAQTKMKVLDEIHPGQDRQGV